MGNRVGDSERRSIFERLKRKYRKENVIITDDCGRTRHNPRRKCVRCGELIDGDVMVPEGEGAMDVECWKDWMGDQE